MIDPDDNRSIDPMTEELLNAYLFSRSNLPGVGGSGRKMMREDRSTQEIIRELDDMAGTQMLSREVFQYMRNHGYVMATQPDGTLKWAMWRDFGIDADIE